MRYKLLFSKRRFFSNRELVVCVCVLTSSSSDIYAGIDEMRIAASGCLFLLDGLRRFRQTFDFESLGCLQESGQLVLGYVDFTCIHEL